MEKRVKQTSFGVSEKDRISLLPDEILVSIISRLRLRETLRTSVLSKRWCYMWTFTFGSLDFIDLRREYSSNRKDPDVQHSRYAKWVNQVMELHQSPTISEFRVYFRSDASYKGIIDKWIEFATAKRAQSIELDFFLHSRHHELYSFPQECYANIPSPHGLSSNKSLRSMTLKYVNVGGDSLELLLSSCPLLERLYVQHSEHLVSVKVAGSSLQLKYLEIVNCKNLKSIEISAPKLMSFKYGGRNVKLRIQSAPRLVDLSIRVPPTESIFFIYNGIASYLPQLETLRLDFSMAMLHVEFPQCELTSLKHLTMRVSKDSDSLPEVSSMIKACPFLHKFTLTVPWQGCKKAWKRPLRREIQSTSKSTHQHLKIVEYNEFVGRPLDFDVVIYLLENAPRLEKCVINPSYRYPNKGWPKRVTFMEDAVSQLQKEVPQGVELIVL